MTDQTCAICGKEGILRNSQINLGLVQNSSGSINRPICARCRSGIEIAEMPKRVWFILTGLLTGLTILILFIGVLNGISVSDTGFILAVLLLGFGAIVSFIVHRRENNRYRQRLIRWLSDDTPEVDRSISATSAITFSQSPSGKIVYALLAFAFTVGMGSLLGIMMWKAIDGLFEIAITAPIVFITALAGSIISMMSFMLLTIVLRVFGPILIEAFEQWLGYIAPVIGGTVGAAIGSGLPVNVLYIIPLSAVTGGLASLIHGVITDKKIASKKSIQDSLIAGVGLGAVNGLILTLFLKLMEWTVGIRWLLAG